MEISNSPWVKFGSAGWVNIQSASTHFPTDLNLLMDAMRKIVTLTVRLCESQGIAGWRQHAYILNKIKRHARTARNKKRSKAKTPERWRKTSKR